MKSYLPLLWKLASIAQLLQNSNVASSNRENVDSNDKISYYSDHSGDINVSHPCSLFVLLKQKTPGFLCFQNVTIGLTIFVQNRQGINHRRSKFKRFMAVISHIKHKWELSPLQAFTFTSFLGTIAREDLDFVFTKMTGNKPMGL